MSDQSPTISVIMPAYNSERFIRESIESVLRQTWTNFELIIVDDCSTDDTPSIIDQMASQDSRIVAIHNTINQRQSESRNKALRQARGKYIAILDHDDIALPERFRLEHEYLETHPDIFMVGTYVRIIDGQGRPAAVIKFPTNPDAIAQQLPIDNCFYHCCVMYRNIGKLFYRDHMRYVEDYDFYLRLLSDGKRLANIPKVLAQYRVHDATDSMKNYPKPIIFKDLAQKFYQQRITNGHDEYETFDPNTILNTDYEQTTDPYLLRWIISARFRMNLFAETRVLCHRYFKHNGWLNTIWVYFFGSFMGHRFWELKRRIKT